MNQLKEKIDNLMQCAIVYKNTNDLSTVIVAMKELDDVIVTIAKENNITLIQSDIDHRSKFIEEYAPDEPEYYNDTQSPMMLRRQHSYRPNETQRANLIKKMNQINSILLNKL